MGVPMLSKGLSLSTLGLSMVVMPSSAYLSSRAFQHSPGLLAVFGEVVAFLDLVGPLLAGERRLVVGDVADQVEVAVVLADFLGQVGQDDAVFFQLLDDGLLFLGAVPAAEEVIQGGILLADLLAGDSRCRTR